MSGKNYAGRTLNTFGDSGSAARFFYCAKASKAERNAGIEEAKGNQGVKGNGLRRVCEFCGAKQMKPEDCKCEVKSWINPPKKNFHPTVKPIALMEYLVRLITPPNGVVLDPFMGSGTTGIAALRLGFEFIGIELSEEYVEIATARIAHWVGMELEFDDEEVMLKSKPQAEWL
jgi:site-specific DNA-methyltransferase (adenine-specific)